MKEIQLPLIGTPAAKQIKRPHVQQHVQVGQFIKSFIYGGLDGTINILTIILSAHAINLHNNTLVAVALAATFGEAVGMGLGDYVSYQSEQEYIMMERHREEYQLEHMREEEEAEMNLLLKGLQYSTEDSSRLTKLYSSKEGVFINLMMMTELGLVVNHVVAWKIGLVNFSSFLIAGVIPLIPYFLEIHSDVSMIFWSAIIGAIQLFTLGYVKGMIIRGDGEVKRRSGLQVLIMGATVTVVGAFIGSLFG